MPVNYSDYIILSLLLILWCIIHSALISNGFLAFINRKIGDKNRYYRLYFNLFSTLTLIPIIIFSLTLKGEYIFQWSGYLHISRIFAIIISLYLFYAGGKYYDGLQFFGIRQIREGSNQKSLSQSGELDMGGILGVIRHPWYTAAIIIIWTRNIDMSTLIVNTIFTLYLIIGTVLEEKKLLLEFGETYRSYQQQVSMLFPIKWLKSKLKKGNLS